jgi:hypothetical protein
MSGFGQVTGQYFVCLLSAFCRFQNLETPVAQNYFAHYKFYYDGDYANSKKHFDHIADPNRLSFDSLRLSLF